MANSYVNGEASTSLSLIRRVQANDEVAWERLSIIYGPVVYQWARQHGLQPHDASDVMQDVLQSLTRNMTKFDLARGKSFRGWLWTVTRNKVNDRYRQKDREVQGQGGTVALRQLNDMAETPPAEDSAPTQSESSGVYRRALSLLETDFEPQTWKAFWRTVVDNVKPADVAVELGISKWAVYKARSRVMQRLRSEFADLM